MNHKKGGKHLVNWAILLHSIYSCSILNLGDVIMLPKYFWRRSLAVYIDYFIFAFLLAIIGLGIQKITNTTIIAPQAITNSTCGEQQIFKKNEMDEFFPLKENQTHLQFLCKVTNMLIENHFIAKVGIKTSDKNKQSVLLQILYVDKNGIASAENKAFDLSNILHIIFPFIMAILLFQKNTSIGKRLLGLQVVRKDNQPLDINTALKREYFKGLPFLAFAIYYFYTLLFPITFQEFEVSSQITIPKIILSIIIAFAAFWFLIGSFIKWNGQSYWDRFADTIVEKKNAPDPTPDSMATDNSKETASKN